MGVGSGAHRGDGVPLLAQVMLTALAEVLCRGGAKANGFADRPRAHRRWLALAPGSR